MISKQQTYFLLKCAVNVISLIVTLVSNKYCQQHQQSKVLTTIAKLPSGLADRVVKGVAGGHLYARQDLNGQFEGGTGIMVIILASDTIIAATLHSAWTDNLVVSL